MHFQELQYIRLLIVGLFERCEGLVLLSEAEIGVHERAGRNVFLLVAPLALITASEVDPIVGAAKGDIKRQMVIPCITV